jgi:ribosomal protection tetracycline resistance protein
VESPSETTRELLEAVTRLGGAVEETRARERFSTIEARMPSDRLRVLQTKLAGLSGGEGSLESAFDGYQPMQGRAPSRRSGSGRWSS